MEYLGLIGKYKINRLLTDEERELNLVKNKKNFNNPVYQLSVIKINSTYIEIVDKFYTWKGLLTSVMLFILVGSIWTISRISWIFFIKKWSEWSHNQQLAGAFSVWLLVLVLSSAFTSVGIWLLRKESFRWTHYPIRLNRKNRMVYVFRLDGTVLSVPWDEVFFTLGRGNKSMGIQNWDIRGHVLDKDKKTVKETFALGYDNESHENLKAYWEYLRRYMEEGPKEPYDLLEYCLPIDQKKEPRLLGLQRLWLDLNGQPFFQILLIPVFLFTWLGRQFAMATCKIPVWPDEVEAACAIEPGDPYVKDGRTNPPDSGLWFP